MMVADACRKNARVVVGFFLVVNSEIIEVVLTLTL